MKHWAMLVALTALVPAVAVAGGSRPTRPPAVLGVNALMKQPQRHPGQVRVEGVVSATSAKQQTLALIDTTEFRQCGTVKCAELSLPVRWTGPMPAVAKAVRVNGRIEKRGGKLIFVAQALTPVKLPARAAR